MNLFKNKQSKAYKISTFDEEDSSWARLGEELAEGQLLVDVCQTPDNIIVKSTMAGVKPENLFISLNRDILTIKGKREDDDLLVGAEYLLRECYFGSFSRTIILPDEVDGKKIEAVLENGVLTVTLKKLYKSQSVKVKIKA